MHCVDLGESVQTHTEYFLAKFSLDTAENEPCQVCPIPRSAAAVRFPVVGDGPGDAFAAKGPAGEPGAGLPGGGDAGGLVRHLRAVQ